MSTSTLSTSNITSGFIDLATFEELEKYLYSIENATNYFVAEHTLASGLHKFQSSLVEHQVPPILDKTGQ